MLRIISRDIIKQVSLYGVVGVANNLLGYLLYIALTHLGMEYKTAMSLLYIVGVAISFSANRKIVFKHTGNIHKAVLKFCLAHILGYTLNFCLLSFFANKMGYPHELVQAAAIFIVAGFLFIFMRFFVFRENA